MKIKKNELSTLKNNYSPKLIKQVVQSKLDLGIISWPELRELAGQHIWVSRKDAFFFWKGFAVAKGLVINKRGLRRDKNVLL
jgi:hypothetical protein